MTGGIRHRRLEGERAMMALVKLTDNEIHERLASLPDWQLDDGKLYREFIFDDFVGAFGFVTRVAIVAEAADHHPDWENVYRRVRIRLSTHEVGGISERDFALAGRINDILNK